MERVLSTQINYTLLSALYSLDNKINVYNRMTGCRGRGSFVVPGCKVTPAWSVYLLPAGCQALCICLVALYTSEANEGGLFMSHFDRE